jgi:hypothetical protein
MNKDTEHTRCPQCDVEFKSAYLLYHHRTKHHGLQLSWPEYREQNGIPYQPSCATGAAAAEAVADARFEGFRQYENRNMKFESETESWLLTEKCKRMADMVVQARSTLAVTYSTSEYFKAIERWLKQAEALCDGDPADWTVLRNGVWSCNIDLARAVMIHIEKAYGGDA